MDKARTQFVCRQCGREVAKWLGRCPGCGGWNTLEAHSLTAGAATPQEIASLGTAAVSRMSLSYTEVNRVLGGGLVPGSLVLLAGEPGIGKSTLVLQLAQAVSSASGPVAYISGEESALQIKLRAERLGVKGDGLFLIAETDLETALASLDGLSPRFVVIDSIQTAFLPEVSGAPGSLSQVRECTLRLMAWAKRHSVPVMLAGHVTKDGSIAGPKTLEHIVDVVLYLEGDAYSSYRLLRGVKNRFGSTQEVGIFEMGGGGLCEVANPSRVFLSSHQEEAAGCAVVPAVEGSRVLLAEVQALTSPTGAGVPRRIASGVDFSRLLLLAAVLIRRCGLPLGSQDIIANVVGGLSLDEPAADLAIALAVASCYRDVPLAPGTVVVGEVGLTGELRPVPALERRMAEAARLGFRRCLAPPGETAVPKGMELIPVATLGQALRLGLRRRKQAGVTASPGDADPAT